MKEDVVVNELCCDLDGEEGGVVSASEDIVAVSLVGTLCPGSSLIWFEFEEAPVPEQ